MGNLCANRIMGGMTVRCIMNMAAGNGPREPLNGAQAGKQRHQSKLSVSQLKKQKKTGLNSAAQRHRSNSSPFIHVNYC